MKTVLAFPKVAGINIYIHWTFSLIIFYIIYINFRAGLTAYQIGWSVLFVLGLFVCVTLHELGHAFAAKRYGIKTKDITLYPIGGVAKLEKMPENPNHELVVAFAGPLVNIIIMILLLPFVLNYNIASSAPENVLVITPANFLPLMAIVNIWLALFNLIPAFPMDGGRVLRALLTMRTSRVKATETAAFIGKLISIVFIIMGFYMNPFLIFIGIFIILGAQAELEMVKASAYITDLKASDALMTNFSSLDKNNPISDAVNKLLDGEAKNFLVTSNGEPFGTIDRNRIIKGLKNHEESDTIENITDTKLVSVDINTPLKDIYTKIQQDRTPVILVTDKNKLAGIIDAENIAELILIKSIRD